MNECNENPTYYGKATPVYVLSVVRHDLRRFLCRRVHVIGDDK